MGELMDKQGSTDVFIHETKRGSREAFEALFPYQRTRIENTVRIRAGRARGEQRDDV